MTTSAIAAASSSSISLQDFLQVLTTQLTYQDPLKPLDNEQFMAQIAQFTTLEQTQQLKESIEQMVSSQAAQQTIGLLGHTVSVKTSSGPVTGSVTSIDLAGATPALTITTSSGTLTGISFGQITSVN